VPGAAGSICLVQKWIHDSAAWEALSTDEQEKAIGRTKADSVELPEHIRGEQSHVSRTVIEENGEELHIFRRNTPFGTPSSHGTMFVGFSADQRILTRMLARMAGVEIGFRDALTGAYYFVPSIQALRAFASEEEEN
jgi:porphyrinogen peroxidase